MEKNGITGFASSDVGAVEKTYVWLADDGEIAASGSIAGNVLKYVAVCSKYKGGGSLFNEVVSQLVNEEASRGRFHLFVFTKPKYVTSFGYVGFKLLGQTDQAALLETGTPGIQDFLQQLPRFGSGITGAIVMNANPFTKGHRALVEKASQECDHVYLFVVQAERSLFTFQERFALVKAGVKDLANVVVVPGGEYMVSSATFPAYFLKSDQLPRPSILRAGTWEKSQIRKQRLVTIKCYKLFYHQKLPLRLCHGKHLMVRLFQQPRCGRQSLKIARNSLRSFFQCPPLNLWKLISQN